MQLFLISKSRKKSFSVTFGPVSICVCLLMGVVAGLMVFHAGSIYSLNLTKESFKNLYSQTTPLWSQEMNQQQQMLIQAKENAERNLDALATRLSKLQAHVMRLDALGSRLADMADLDEIDFNIDSTPGLGGPKPVSVQDTMEVADFLEQLDELNMKIQDREEKLAAMESMLIDRTLRNQTIPTGSPAVDGWVSSLFGMRTDPMTGKREFHGGIDFAGKSGSPIQAVGSGIVTWSGQRYGYGNMVEINHGNGYLTRYSHNKKNLVVVGQKVDKEQVIALMGSSGRATGPHVHFEVVNNGKLVNPKDFISLK